MNGVTQNDLWVYNTTGSVWTQLTPFGLKGLPKARMGTISFFDQGRIVMYSGVSSSGGGGGGGGNSHDNAGEIFYDDMWQLVLSQDCLAYTSGCANCISVVGCGWCKNNPPLYRCIPGVVGKPYIMGDCLDGTYSTNIMVCPVGSFPGWGVALITLVIFGVFVGVWFLFLRWQRDPMATTYLLNRHPHSVNEP
eukprot:TRINITY_DN2160_c0_g1_i9.p1 TRINITY_DN2160_c0_g1~~TRINITY_DN2160_c0_g1_i9.p1  ORF type:complete len:193 (+),score=37.58 TRINITY_DN2160_c0_g1_i9:307-885(+)